MVEATPTRTRSFGQVLWFVAWVAITVFGIILTPASEHHGTHTQLGLPPCSSVVLCGRPCPGCGMTTSITAFLHGQFVESFLAHPFGALMYLAYSVSAWAAILAYRRGVALNTDDRRLNAALAVFLVAFLAFGIIRFATVSGLTWSLNSWNFPLPSTR